MTDRTDREALTAAARMILAEQPAVAVTGAGMSVASGIADFRSPGGLWERYDPFDYAHIGSFKRDPARVWMLLREMFGAIGGKSPNAGHLALAELEQLGLLSAIVTQNIDGLHQKAGSRRVVEFHGGHQELECIGCGFRCPPDLEAITGPVEQFRPPVCAECGRVMKPAVVLFGEAIPGAAMAEAEGLAGGCRMVLVVGTSATVAPASMLPQMARSRGAKVLEVNLERTALTRSGATDLLLDGRQEEILPRLVEEIRRLGS